MFELERLDNIRRLLEAYEDTFELVHHMIYTPEKIEQKYNINIIDALTETDKTLKIIFEAVQMHLNKLEEQTLIKVNGAKESFTNSRE
jgi:division protein CdvB (Snf7/Vps24/ESCRT-III family)